MTPTQCLGQEVSRSQKDTGNGVVRPDVSGMPGAGILSSGSRFRSAGSQSNSRRPRATLIPTRPLGDTFPCPRGRLPVPAGGPCPRPQEEPRSELGPAPRGPKRDRALRGLLSRLLKCHYLFSFSE